MSPGQMQPSTQFMFLHFSVLFKAKSSHVGRQKEMHESYCIPFSHILAKQKREHKFYVWGILKFKQSHMIKNNKATLNIPYLSFTLLEF